MKRKRKTLRERAVSVVWNYPPTCNTNVKAWIWELGYRAAQRDARKKERKHTENWCENCDGTGMIEGWGTCSLCHGTGRKKIKVKVRK